MNSKYRHIAAHILFRRKLAAIDKSKIAQGRIWQWLLSPLLSGSWTPDIGHNIVLKHYKSIYMAVPKVANSSLKHLFANELGLDGKSDRRGGKAYLFNHKKTRKQLAKKDILITRSEAARRTQFFRFAFVRNPWDRIASYYFSAMKSDHIRSILARNYGTRFSKPMSLDAFVEIVTSIPDKVADRHFMSQHCYLCDNNGSLIPDHIGRFENLEEDFRFVCSTIGIENRELQNVNLGRSSRDYRSLFSTQSADHVHSRYKKDIELFGYEF